jgi:penicillin-binding protein 1A
MTQKNNMGFFSFLIKFLKWCAYLAISGIALLAIAGLIFYLHISKDLPNLSKIEDYRPPVMAEVYDDQNKKIGEFWTEARILTPIDQIPKKLIQAFVSSEDDRFFEHKGVDPYGILRAFIRNFRAGQVVQGASTITQQVTKALLLSPERTYQRKIKEAILATQIEKNLTKEQILYIYLNQVYFGNRAYGVAAAARNYFHKDLKDLSLGEIAMIAGLAKAPSMFNPVINPERARQRMEYVLGRMAEEGYITPAEAEVAKKSPVWVYQAPTDKEFNMQYAPYFVEEVRRQLVKKYGADKLYSSGWKIYTTGNLKMNQDGQKAVIHGVEPYSKILGYRGPLQHLADQAAIDHFLMDTHLQILDETGQINYFTDPGLKESRQKTTPLKTGEVYNGVLVGVSGGDLKVRVGNAEGTIPASDWAWAKTPARKAKPWTPQIGDVIETRIKTADASQEGGQEKASEKAHTLAQNFTLYQSPEVESALFSYEPFTGAVKAVVGGQSYRQSEFDRATQALLQPGSSIKPLIYAAALDKGYSPGTIIMDSPIVYEESPGKFWSPKNYGGKYYGPTALRNALVNSRNVVTVRILMDIGTHYVAGFMRKMGITTPIYKYYSMALGSNEVKLSELANAYGTFPTGGVYPQLFYVSKIVDPKGQVVEEHKPSNVNYVISYQDVKESADKSSKIPGPEKPPIAETQPHPETQPHGKSPESQPTAKKTESWEEMGYNQSLLASFDEKTKGDDLLLTSYEKKALVGDYIPEGYTITPKTAMTMVGILQDVVRAGTGTRALALQKPAAGKTGTTNESTDAWFIGFTPTLLTGVWVGFDGERRTLGHGVTGGHLAAPIWLEYMKEATKNYPTKNFTVPQWVDLSIYEAPIQVGTGGGGDAEMGEAGVGTGVTSTGAEGPSSGGPAKSSAEFFAKDLQ